MRWFSILTFFWNKQARPRSQNASTGLWLRPVYGFLIIPPLWMMMKGVECAGRPEGIRNNAAYMSSSWIPALLYNTEQSAGGKFATCLGVSVPDNTGFLHRRIRKLFDKQKQETLRNREALRIITILLFGRNFNNKVTHNRSVGTRFFLNKLNLT